MINDIDPTGSSPVFNVSYDRAAQMATAVMRSATAQNETLLYTVLGIAMALGRFLQPQKRLTPEEEIAFIQSLMDWAELYLMEPKGEA